MPQHWADDDNNKHVGWIGSYIKMFNMVVVVVGRVVVVARVVVVVVVGLVIWRGRGLGLMFKIQKKNYNKNGDFLFYFFRVVATSRQVNTHIYFLVVMTFRE